MEYKEPKKLVEYFQKNLQDAIKESRIETKTAGITKKEFHNIWLEVDRKQFREAVKLLTQLHYPHIAIISGNDTGETIDLVYHFSLYYGQLFNEISVNIRVELEGKKPSIDSITDLIPGAQTTERETKEMLGVQFVGLPEMHNIFLPEDFPKNVHPFRKNEKGLDELVQKES